ncbi:damage-inducible mutagenesis protein [Starkeya sp. ORNL1]|uniref:ImuA family protein n=1 Tax=Starkeya sp. ORNL1 TaxID=2709380 RepID=UPI001FED87E9|nr:damage-inducible mutagenesis protein [Starkeya sp. ORNL1]
MSGHAPLLAELRERIAHLDGSGVRVRPGLPFGVEAIDRHLPGGGLLRGALHEVSGAGEDFTYGAAAALFIAGVLARLDGPVLWCLRRRDLFAPGLANAGLDPDRVIYAEAGDAKNVLLAMEEGLRHAPLAGVVGEIDRIGLTASRRLNLAAEESGVLAFALKRGWRHGDVEREEPSAAHTRWRVGAMPSRALEVPGLGRALWRLELTRCRNGEAAQWLVEACDEQGRIALADVGAARSAPATPAPAPVAVPAELSDRPAARPSPIRRAAGGGAVRHRRA